MLSLLSFGFGLEFCICLFFFFFRLRKNREHELIIILDGKIISFLLLLIARRELKISLKLHTS